MKKEHFDKLVASIKEAGEIKAGQSVKIGVRTQFSKTWDANMYAISTTPINTPAPYGRVVTKPARLIVKPTY
jgi:hypothetical protein